MRPYVPWQGRVGLVNDNQRDDDGYDQCRKVPVRMRMSILGEIECRMTRQLFVASGYCQCPLVLNDETMYLKRTLSISR